MRYASLSLDLDNQWSYMKTHGDAGWQSHPSYLDAVVPRMLDFLAARRLTISFFIVGQDAALEKNRAALRAIVARVMRSGTTASGTNPGSISTARKSSTGSCGRPRRQSSR